MSGPKVVHIVTREEILAICNRSRGDLERAVVSWEASAAQLGGVDAAAQAGARTRLTQLVELLQADRFAEFQEQVPGEIAFLKADVERLRAKATGSRAIALQQGRQLKGNARALIRELQAKGCPVSADVMSRLGHIASGSLVGRTAEASVAEAFRMLATPSAPASLTDAQREIAARLNVKDLDDTFATWRATRTSGSDKRMAGVEKRLAELSTYLHESELKKFSDRSAFIAQAEQSADMNLQIDSLVLDISAAVFQAKQRSALVEEAAGILVELGAPDAAADRDAQTSRTNLELALKDLDFPRLATLAEETRAMTARLRARQVAAARRDAILAGLQSLGYEVREGMSTAWEQNGRVVLRSPSDPGYGVEIASAADAERMQVRAVAFYASRDQSRDFGVETTWCGDFGKLQALVASQGGAIQIERGLAVGAIPLKVVGSPENAAQEVVSSLARGQ
jgi:hypothetical protein